MLTRSIMLTLFPANLWVLEPHLQSLSSDGSDLCIPCCHGHQSDQVTTRSIHSHGLSSEQLISHNFQNVSLDNCLLAWVPVTKNQCLSALDLEKMVHFHIQKIVRPLQLYIRKKSLHENWRK